MNQDTSIIFENKNYIAVNKPAGIAVHADGRSKELTLADWIVSNFPYMSDVGENIVTDDGRIILKP